MLPDFVYITWRSWIHFSMKMYHKELVTRHAERVPSKGPVIFCPSHINGLIDALAVGVTNPRIQIFLTKGEMFVGPKAKFLPYFNMAPLYRRNHNKNAKTLNRGVFDSCIKILQAGKVFTIFPEGMHQNFNYLKAIKRGAAVIGFQTLERDPELELYMQPVGLYYDKPEDWGRDLLTTYSEPIRLNDYWQAYQEDKRGTVEEVMRLVRKRILNDSIHIDDIANYEFWDELSNLYVSEQLHQKQISNRLVNKFQIKQSVTKQLSQIKQHEQFPRLQAKFQELRSKVDLESLPEYDLNRPDESAFSSVFRTFVHILLSPVFLLAAVLNLPLLTIPCWWVRNKVKNIRFYTTTRLMLRSFITLVWYPMVIIASMLYFRSVLAGPIAFVLLYLSARFLRLYGLSHNKLDAENKRKSWMKAKGPELPAVRSLHQEVFSLLDQILLG